MAKTTGIAQFSQGKSEVHKVDPRLLVIKEGWNTREETPELLEHIDMLAQSIAEVGVKNPIQIKLEDGKLIVKAGHCRTRAVIRAMDHYKAEIKTVPVVSVDRYASDEDLILEQVITNSGKPLTTMEEAKVYKKLLDMGWNQADIAKKVGKSGGRISQILSLLTMPIAAQQAVASGAISASLAQQVVKAAETPAQASQQLQKAVETAKAEGRKVKPVDVGASQGLYALLKQAFEDSDIDCSQEIVAEGVVNITMPLENFEAVRKALML